MSDIAIVSHPDCALHEMGPGQPESPARFLAVDDALTGSGLALRRVEAPLASREQLIGAHAPEYVDDLLARSPENGYVRLDVDTVMCPSSVAAARRAAGAAVHAVDLVVGGTVRGAFCPVRPPGHHAERSRAMGFCLFNNVAVAAAHALARHRLERVAIIDFDVHHGNGTEQIFRDDRRVLFCSSFQHPHYPHSGADTVSDHVINVPLAAGTDGAMYRDAVGAAWLDRLNAFRPELVMFSAGFDAHVDDPLGDLRLTEADYTWITQRVAEVADAHAGGRIVSTLEGGYNLAALGRSVVAHLEAMS